MAFDLGYEQEKRILMIMIGLSLLGLVLMLISVNTDYWLHMDLPDTYNNKTKFYYIERHSGLWRHCKTLYRNDSEPAVTSKYAPR